MSGVVGRLITYIGILMLKNIGIIFFSVIITLVVDYLASKIFDVYLFILKDILIRLGAPNLYSDVIQYLLTNNLSFLFMLFITIFYILSGKFESNLKFLVRRAIKRLTICYVLRFNKPSLSPNKYIGLN
jgi:hypothetical protein